MDNGPPSVVELALLGVYEPDAQDLWKLHDAAAKAVGFAFSLEPYDREIVCGMNRT